MPVLSIDDEALLLVDVIGEYPDISNNTGDAPGSLRLAKAATRWKWFTTGQPQILPSLRPVSTYGFGKMTDVPAMSATDLRLLNLKGHECPSPFGGFCRMKGGWYWGLPGGEPRRRVKDSRFRLAAIPRITRRSLWKVPPRRRPKCKPQSGR